MNGGTPLVSVVIPCYNRAEFTGAAIESALGQTHHNLEVIVVNDGSTEGGTDDVMRRYAENARVRYFRHPTNRGIPSARNTGIRHARGEYIAFLDSDDMWLPNKLELQLEVFSHDERGEVGAVWTNTYVVDPSGNLRTSDIRVPREINSLPSLDFLRILFLGNIITAPSVMIRRSCFDRIGLLDEELMGGSDDYDLWLRLASHFKFRYLATPLATIRLHGNNYSSVERQIRDGFLIVEKAVAAHAELATLKRAKLARLHYRLGVYYLEKGNGQQAKGELRQAMSYAPLAVKPLLAWALAHCGFAGASALRTWLIFRG